MDTTVERPFIYRQFRFNVFIENTATDLYMARVNLVSGPNITAEHELPPDADPYASVEEAWRHGEQQAMRWVHDRTGDGQGQF